MVEGDQVARDFRNSSIGSWLSTMLPAFGLSKSMINMSVSVNRVSNNPAANRALNLDIA